MKQVQGRGASTNVGSRFESRQVEAFDDGWQSTDEVPIGPPTQVRPEYCRSLISTNDSPDLAVHRTINPYRGCEHGCAYCFARPSHAYLGLSPGLDFETQIRAKVNGAAVLRAELRKRGYTPAILALGANTDPYQPAERHLGVTRQILEVLAEHRHPVTILTKSNLVLRDLDLLAPMAADGLCSVALSVTTLQRNLGRRLEPRAATPQKRLEAIRMLTAAGIPTQVWCAPLIPAVNDIELEAILTAAQIAGAQRAGYVLLRLPHELKELFAQWLQAHLPERKDHVLALVRGCRDGALYDADFSQRMRGSGAYAKLLEARFKSCCRRLGLSESMPPLRSDIFAVPPQAGEQMPLF